MRRNTGALIAVLLLSFVGEARASNKLIAVLPLDIRHTGGKLSEDGQAFLEEMLRDVATNNLGAAGWTVMSGENTFELLKGNGIDASKVCDSTCALDAARELKTDKFLSGVVEYLDGEFSASVRLFDTRTGSILASEFVSGKNPRALRTAFEEKAPRFFQKAGMMTPPEGTDDAAQPPAVDDGEPRVKKSKVTEAVGNLTVTAKPKEKVRLELIDPNGKKIVSTPPYENARAAPGQWTVTARASGYEEEKQIVDVPADDAVLVKFDLKHFGGLSVTGTPAGADVHVTGPGGFNDEGGLPWEASGLKHGTYQVKVSRNGYADDNQTIDVAPGNTATLTIALRKSASHEATTSIATTVATDTNGGVEFIAIPGGTFTYGCEAGDTSCDSDERPSKSVTVSSFSMTKTEITVADYRKCVSARVCSSPDSKSFINRCNWDDDGREKHPINCVDWDQAKAFCKWIGGRLPTAEEWEYAAKSGEHRIYPWGNDKPNGAKANFQAGQTEPVGSYPAGASKFGLLDMAGNVAEWTINDAPHDDKEIRGGGRDNNEDDIRNSHREGVGSDRRSAVIGIRCVR